jgi:hypothetical protein
MSETIPRLIADGGQSNAEVVINDNAKSLGAVMLYAKHPPSCSALVWGVYGGNWLGSTIGTLYSTTQTYHATVTLTDASTNYVVAHRTTGAVTTSTATTNWNDTGVYGRLHKLTTSGGAVTAAEDWRFLTGGIFDFGAAPSGTVAAGDVNITDAGGYYTGTEVETALQEIGAALQSAGKVPAQRYDIELANTTDSDPGAGLIKFNNATPASATELYIDDSTSDGVDLSTLFASFGAAGFIKIQSVADAGEWAIFKWTATTDQTGYWKFAVTPQASKGTLDDADAVLIEFDSGGSSGGAVATDTIWDAAGDLVYGTGSNTGARLAIGTARQALLVNAGATAPEWGVVDSDDVAYAATTVADWNGSADPGDVEQALDQLAERTKDLEGAAAGSGTKTYAVFTPMTSQPPAANFATLDTRNSIAVLDFDDSTDESAFWVGVMPEAASLGSGLKIRIHWMATSATSGTVRWGAQLERMNTDLDSDSFDTVATAGTATSGTTGIATVTEITLTTIDSVAAGELYRVKVYRDADGTSGTDDVAGDAELIAVEVRSAA